MFPVDHARAAHSLCSDQSYNGGTKFVIKMYLQKTLSTFFDRQKTQMAAPLAKNPSTPVTEAQLPIKYSKVGGGFIIILNQSVVDLKN